MDLPSEGWLHGSWYLTTLNPRNPWSQKCTRLIWSTFWLDFSRSMARTNNQLGKLTKQSQWDQPIHPIGSLFTLSAIWQRHCLFCRLTHLTEKRPIKWQSAVSSRVSRHIALSPCDPVAVWFLYWNTMLNCSPDKKLQTTSYHSIVKNKVNPPNTMTRAGHLRKLQ